MRAICCAVLLLTGLAGAFNLAPRHAHVIADPQGQRGSYFGYTVALQRGGDTPSVIVGAPRANSSHADHQDLVEPGVVYKCSLLFPQEECVPILLDARGNVEHDDEYMDKKDNAWIGAAIDVQDEQGGLVVCGPRWKNQRIPLFYLMNGVCYWKPAPIDSQKNALVKLPLLRLDYQGKKVNTTDGLHEAFYYAYGGAGISVHLTKNGTEMIIGAPGVLDWAGSVIRYTTQEDEFPVSSSRKKRFTDEDFFRSALVPNPLHTPRLQSFGYFGYSLDSGVFLRGGEVQYVSGAPRSAELRGSVFVFRFPGSADAEYPVLVELQGAQLGEYFGAAVCAVDLNGDGLDDLLVGAPSHSLGNLQGTRQMNGDEGRVYVYINKGNTIMTEIGDDNRIMGKPDQGARFGTTISRLGDIDMDGYNDVAVGAPYEDSGRGAIYVYHGQASGINHRYSQRITAREIHPALAGFGLSISRGLDVDGNHYNDVGVGAYVSGHAVVIKSRPVVTLRPRLTSSVDIVGFNVTSFHVTACLGYSGRHAPSLADVHVVLSVKSDSVARFDDSSDTHVYHVTLRGPDNEDCQDAQVTVVKREGQDFTKPIEVSMFYEIDDRESKPPRKREINDRAGEFCSSCPMVDPTRSQSTSIKVPYATGCGDDTVCQSDVSLQVFFQDNITSPFIIGSRSKLRLKIVVSNVGEPAFLVKLNISFPSSTPLSHLPSLCQEVAAAAPGVFLLDCDVANPLPTGTQKTVFLDLDMSGLSDVFTPLLFSFNASTVGVDTFHDNNFVRETLQLASVSRVTITGAANQNQLVFSQLNHTFSHTYEVRNFGPSPVQLLQLDFRIPVAMTTSNGTKHFLSVYTPRAYLNSDQPFTCTTSEGQSFSSEARETDSDSDSEYHVFSKRSVTDMRSTDLNAPLSPADSPSNATLVVNCSTDDVTCLQVTCDVGPFLNAQARAVVTFRMRAAVAVLAPLLGKRDVILLTTTGSVGGTSPWDDEEVTGSLSDVSTALHTSLPRQTLGWMWLAVAVSIGVLILLMVVGGLIKAGFFRREKKEELESLKENSLINDVLEDMNVDEDEKLEHL